MSPLFLTFPLYTSRNSQHLHIAMHTPHPYLSAIWAAQSPFHRLRNVGSASPLLTSSLVLWEAEFRQPRSTPTPTSFNNLGGDGSHSQDRGNPRYDSGTLLMPSHHARFPDHDTTQYQVPTMRRNMKAQLYYPWGSTPCTRVSEVHRIRTAPFPDLLDCACSGAMPDASAHLWCRQIRCLLNANIQPTV